MIEIPFALIPDFVPEYKNIPPGAKCGNCLHCEREEYHRKTYFKCRLKNHTRGPGTDLRLKWRACPKWEPKEGKDETT